MSAVLDAVDRAVWFGLVPWLFIMVPMTACLAYRRGWSVTTGAMLGLIPVPFAGWIIVLAVTRRDQPISLTSHRVPDAPRRSDPDDGLGDRI